MAKLNLNRQQQSNNIPFMTSPLVDICSYLANDKPAIEVIDGTFVPPEGTPQYVLEFLEVLKMLDAIRALGSVDLSITPEENQMGWGKMKGRTGSEPSTPGFEQCKTSSMDANLNVIDTFLRNTATIPGIAYCSWKIVTDLQI